jgi:4'-phosphopantetheinyl transferase
MGEQVRRSAAVVLAADERARARALGDATLRAWFAASHLALRAVLADFRPELALGETLARSPHGKPYLPDGPEMSFSATAGLALLAVSRAGPVGVDVERVRDIAFADAALARSPALSALIEEKSRVQSRTLAFLGAWTALEATLKYHGLPLAPALDRLGEGVPGLAELSPGPARQAPPRLGRPDVGHGFVAACAHAGRAAPRQREFDWPAWAAAAA